MNCADYHVVGCGDRTVSMWDHRNGNLLIDIEIELPTIGRNIACYTVGGEDVSISLNAKTKLKFISNPRELDSF